MRTAFFRWEMMLGTLVVLAAIAAPAPSFAQADAGQLPESKASSYTAQISAARATAAGLKNEYDQMTGELPDGGVYADDLAEAKKVYEGLGADFERAAEAWSNGDGDQAQEIFNKAQAALSAKDVWRRRLTEYRRAQDNAAPTRQWYFETAAVARAGTLGDFYKLVAAKKATAEAWRDVAEAAVPGAAPNKIEELKEKAFAAQAEIEIATWRFSWANQLDGAWAGQSITPQDVKQSVDALRKDQDELVALRREQVAHERQVRQVMAAMAKAQDDLYRAIGAAREAKARAATTP